MIWHWIYSGRDIPIQDDVCLIPSWGKKKAGDPFLRKESRLDFAGFLWNIFGLLVVTDGFRNWATLNKSKRMWLILVCLTSITLLHLFKTSIVTSLKSNVENNTFGIALIFFNSRTQSPCERHHKLAKSKNPGCLGYIGYRARGSYYSLIYGL